MRSLKIFIAATSAGFLLLHGCLGGSTKKSLRNTEETNTQIASRVVTGSEDIVVKSIAVPLRTADVKGKAIVGCVFGPLLEGLKPVDGSCSLYAATNVGEILKIDGSTVKAEQNGSCGRTSILREPNKFRTSPECYPFLGYMALNSDKTLVFSDRGEEDFLRTNSPSIDALGLVDQTTFSAPAAVTTIAPVASCGYKNQFSSLQQCLESQANCMRSGWVYVSGCNYYCDGAPAGVLTSAYTKCDRPDTATGLNAQPEAFNYGLLSTAGQGAYNLADGTVKLPFRAAEALGTMMSSAAVGVGSSVQTCTTGGAGSWFSYGMACVVTAGVGAAAATAVVVLLPEAVVGATVAGAATTVTGLLTNSYVLTAGVSLGVGPAAYRTMDIALDQNQSIGEQIARMDRQAGDNFLQLALAMLGYAAAPRAGVATLQTAATDAEAAAAAAAASKRAEVVDFLTKSGRPPAQGAIVYTGDATVDIAEVQNYVQAARKLTESGRVMTPQDIAAENKICELIYKSIMQRPEMQKLLDGKDYVGLQSAYESALEAHKKMGLIFSGINTRTTDSARFAAVGSDLGGWLPQYHQTVSLVYGKLVDIVKRSPNGASLSPDELAAAVRNLATDSNIVRDVMTAKALKGGLGLVFEDALTEKTAIDTASALIQASLKQDVPLYRLVAISKDPAQMTSAELTSAIENHMSAKTGIWSTGQSPGAVLEFTSSFPPGTKFAIIKYQPDSAGRIIPINGSGPVSETAASTQIIAGNAGFVNNEIVIVNTAPVKATGEISFLNQVGPAGSSSLPEAIPIVSVK